MPKVIQMSHMILRRLSVQECEQFLLIFFAINTFLSPNHIMSKNLYNATAFPQLGVGTTAESNVNRFSIKTEKVHFENFLQSETLFGVNRSYKTPTEKKKTFSRILTLMLSFFLCMCLLSAHA